ncbi:MAG: DUF5662 family protein [Eggerthellaceae bacterium]
MSLLSNVWHHFCTITHHKAVVLGHCWQVGLYWQGLVHDLSKYSWTEFRVGMRYYQGDKSPNTAERADLGYSTAWMHHKGRNKHHYEYWIDMKSNRNATFEGKPIPTRYVVEMLCDRMAASKVYQGSAYTDSSPLEYFMLEQSAQGELLFHPESKALLLQMLTWVQEEGEKVAFRRIRQEIVKARYRTPSTRQF